MFQYTAHNSLLQILTHNQPQALAWVSGSSEYPQINGMVKFYQVPYNGILIEAEIFNLPNYIKENTSAFFGFHIHEIGDCEALFQSSGGHYNPQNSIHPFHSGDLPPLLSDQGYAWTVFYDDRFTIHEIVDRSVIIHLLPDDFMTQPAGNSGERIACGIIHPAELPGYHTTQQ